MNLNQSLNLFFAIMAIISCVTFLKHDNYRLLFLEHATIKLPELHYYNLPVSDKKLLSVLTKGKCQYEKLILPIVDHESLS